MNNFKNSILIFMLSILASTQFISCGDNMDEEIAGQCENEEDRALLTGTYSGSVNASFAPNNGVVNNFSLRISAGDQECEVYEILLNDGGETIELSGELAGDQFILTGSDERVIWGCAGQAPFEDGDKNVTITGTGNVKFLKSTDPLQVSLNPMRLNVFGADGNSICSWEYSGQITKQ